MNKFTIKKWLSNPIFKSKIVLKMKNLLQDVYEPHGKFKNGGVCNLDWESTEWSILNKMTSNYTALENIFAYMKAVSKGKLDVYAHEFMSESFLKCIDDLFELCHKNKKIFLALDLSDSKLISGIVKEISSSTIFGNMSEKVTKRFILKNNPNVNFVETTRSEDMLKGIDLSFMYNNKKYTIQVKRTTMYETSDGESYIFNIGTSKLYKVNYYAMHTDSNFYFIRNNENIKMLRNGGLLIPKENVIFIEELTDFDKELLKK